MPRVTAAATHYRVDVDGLRAFAVLSVIGYHLKALPLPGAFVTLDIFFVISGYLIGAHVMRDIEAGNFSTRTFYVRRVRRIIPALAVMLTATGGACTLLLYPDELARFGASLAAAAVAAGNLFFWADTDYFAAHAQTAPLLHTWSLAVEEQFYLLFPALMLLLYRRLPRAWIGRALGAILLASLAVASVVAFRDPTSAFYLPHMRVWEFLIGTVILYLPPGVLARAWVREAAVAAGLAMVAASMLLLRTTMPFPGLAAVPAVLGTATVIAAGEHGATLGGRLLSIAPARWIARISYSLYLWHWPLMLIYKAARPVEALGRGEKAGLFAATLVVGTLSWRFVEEPFRRGRRSPRVVFAGAAAALAAIAAAGLLLWHADGFPARIDPAERRLVAFERDHVPPRPPGCHMIARDDVARFTRVPCLRVTPGARNVLLIGDSHANHLWQALAEQGGAALMQVTAAGCRPTLAASGARNPTCRLAAREGFGLLARARPDLVILSARWTEADLEDLDRTLAWLAAHGQRVVLSGPIAQYDASLPVLLALARHRGDPALPQRHLLRDTAGLDARMAAMAERHGVRYLSPYRAICPRPGACRTVTAQGVPLQHDYGHLTREGARAVLRAMLGGRPLLD